MQLSYRHRKMIASGFLLLLLGLVNYILFRPGMILTSFLPDRPILSFPDHPYIHSFFAGHCSDILWCMALYLTTVVLSETKRIGRSGAFFMLTLPFVTEIAQFFRLIPGTFDWMDILSYLSVYLLFNFLFSFIKLIDMKMIKPALWPLAIYGIFLAMAFACATPQHTYKYKPPPCIKHSPMTYSPILIKVNLSGNYNMKDLQGAQRSRQVYVLDALNALNYSKYKMADGVTQNMTINITLTTDGYEHYGATVFCTVFDGDFTINLDNNYITLEKIYDDLAAKIDVFVRYGWCKNCPTPCTIP